MNWRRLADLPLGIGGQFAGVDNGALVVAGGSRFPVSFWDGGRKNWLDGVYVLPHRDGEWRRFELPRRRAYGGSVSDEQGILLIGGSDEEKHHRECWRVHWDGEKIEVEPSAPLPEPLANFGATGAGGRAYVFGGQRAVASTSSEGLLYSLEVSDAARGWRGEQAFPGPDRILPAMAAGGGLVYVGGGAMLSRGQDGGARRTYLRDAWSYMAGQGWRALPEMPEFTCAAPAFGFDGGFAVAGGSDGTLDARAAELRDGHPGFSRSLKVYSAKANAWRVAGTLPFSLVTTTAVAWDGFAVIPGGEDRPGHRSTEVWALPLRELRDAAA